MGQDEPVPNLCGMRVLSMRRLFRLLNKLRYITNGKRLRANFEFDVLVCCIQHRVLQYMSTNIGMNTVL